MRHRGESKMKDNKKSFGQKALERVQSKGRLGQLINYYEEQERGERLNAKENSDIVGPKESIIILKSGIFDHNGNLNGSIKVNNGKVRSENKKYIIDNLYALVEDLAGFIIPQKIWDKERRNKVLLQQFNDLFEKLYICAQYAEIKEPGINRVKTSLEQWRQKAIKKMNYSDARGEIFTALSIFRYLENFENLKIPKIVIAYRTSEILESFGIRISPNALLVTEWRYKDFTATNF
jgi:hypothetical protein